MSKQIEDYIVSIEQRLSRLEALVGKTATMIDEQRSDLQKNNTARRINVNSTSYIDADGKAVLSNLELTNLEEVSSATYVLSISGNVVSFVEIGSLSSTSLPIYSGDPDTNGTWKIHADDGNFHIQCRINGTYQDQILQTPTNEDSL